MDAIFQCVGTTDELNDRLNMSASEAAKNWTLILRNQAGTPSRLDTVGRSFSSIPNICQSVMCSFTCQLFMMDLTLGVA